MKNLSIYFVGTFGLLFSAQVHAILGFEGVGHGGGGDEIVAEFVSIAHALSRDEGFDPQDREVLKTALESSKIVMRKTLINPVTKQPIPKQDSLVAWGSPGLIQIKLASEDRTEISWTSLRDEGLPVRHYVFHELYRASGIIGPNGRSPDDSFELSIGKYRLNSSPVSTKFEPCYMAISRLLSREHSGKLSAFVDFKDVTISRVPGASVGMIGFARIYEWTEFEENPVHMNTYSVSATCESGETGFVLSDRNLNDIEDLGDFKIDYIDFERN